MSSRGVSNLFSRTSGHPLPNQVDCIRHEVKALADVIRRRRIGNGWIFFVASFVVSKIIICTTVGWRAVALPAGKLTNLFYFYYFSESYTPLCKPHTRTTRFTLSASSCNVCLFQLLFWYLSVVTITRRHPWSCGDRVFFYLSFEGDHCWSPIQLF